MGIRTRRIMLAAICASFALGVGGLPRAAFSAPTKRPDQRHHYKASKKKRGKA